jgi:flavin-dependent dehydrogenase
VIAPTLSAETAGNDVWDVIVIGAGPAGAVAARQAALAGGRVLLVDAKAFPRAKVCGACLNSRALALLREVGLDEIPVALGGVPVDQFRVRSSGREAQLALPVGIAVSRARFDAALVNAAITAGADFLPEATALVGEACGSDQSECRVVSLRRGGAGTVLARARVVLAADGLGHASLRNHPEFSSRVAGDARIGVGGQLAEYPAEYGAGTIFMAVGRHGYVGLVQIEEGQLNVAGALAPEFVKSAGGPAPAIGAVLKEAGFPPIVALCQADWHGTVPLTRSSARAAGRRVLLLGDAAGYVEPFTGEGMAWALAAAGAVAQFAARGAFEWHRGIEREWQRALRRLVTNHQRWCRVLAIALRHPWAVRALLSAVSLAPTLAGPIIRSVNRPPAPMGPAAFPGIPVRPPYIGDTARQRNAAAGDL